MTGACVQVAVDAADVAETSARKEDQEAEKALRDVQSELAAMRRHVGGRGQAAAMWGREAPALLDAIAREPRRFSAPPIGPIGAHLSLRDPQCVPLARGPPCERQAVLRTPQHAVTCRCASVEPGRVTFSRRPQGAHRSRAFESHSCLCTP